MYDTDISNVGQKIKYFRKTKNVSTEDLGIAIKKVKQQLLNTYENSV